METKEAILVAIEEAYQYFITNEMAPDKHEFVEKVCKIMNQGETSTYDYNTMIKLIDKFAPEKIKELFEVDVTSIEKEGDSYKVSQSPQPAQMSPAQIGYDAKPPQAGEYQERPQDSDDVQEQRMQEPEDFNNMRVYSKGQQWIRAKKDTLAVPENWSLNEDLKVKDCEVWSGGNDWEVGNHYVAIMKPYSHDTERYWIRVNYDQFENGPSNEGQSKEKEEWGDKAKKLFVSKIKDQLKEHSLNRDVFEAVVGDEELKPYIAEHGIDVTKWVEKKEPEPVPDQGKEKHEEIEKESDSGQPGDGQFPGQTSDFSNEREGDTHYSYSAKENEAKVMRVVNPEQEGLEDWQVLKMIRTMLPFQHSREEVEDIAKKLGIEKEKVNVIISDFIRKHILEPGESGYAVSAAFGSEMAEPSYNPLEQ